MIRKITSTETIPVRNVILRPGQPPESCIFEGDDAEGTVHFGYTDETKIVGIASVLQRSCPNFDTIPQVQVRGMAVLEAYSGKNIGRMLLTHIEGFARQQGVRLIWMNARSSAIEFYKKSGYESDGEIFEISGVGPHILMYKKL